MNAVRHCGLMIVLLVLPATCLAAPWGDYELAIGDGYSIIVFTEGTVWAKDGRVVLDPGDYQGAPSCIDRYAATRRHIFVRNYTAFFVLAKGEDSVIGPLSGAEFEQHPIVRASGPLDWRQPHNPHPYPGILLLLLGSPIRSFGGAIGLWACMAIGLAFVAAKLLLAGKRLRRDVNLPVEDNGGDIARRSL